METRTQRRPRRNVNQQGVVGRAIIIALLVVALACAGTLFYMQWQEKKAEEQRQGIMFSDTFHKGITVGGVDVGGLTYAQALEAMQRMQDAAMQDVHLTLSCKGSTYTADPTFFTITSDAEAQLRDAFALAREGSLESLQVQLAGIETTGRDFGVTYTVKPILEKFETLIDTISAAVDTAPTAATATVKPIGVDEKTDLPACFNIGMPEGGVTLENGTVVTDIRDLRFDFKEGEPGYGVDHDALMQTIVERAAAQDWSSLAVPLGEIEPEVTVQTLKDTMLVLRGQAVTKYSGSASRIFNIKKAVGLVYGTMIEPGMQYSHNGKLGDRTEAGGWQLAPAVIDGGANHEDQAGGGVCQTSTTLYQAVLTGDYQVDSRRGHSTKSSYAKGGLDCTIADSTTGNIDFLWTNNTTAPVYVFMWLDTENKRCYAEIYGVPYPTDAFDEIQLHSELVETIPPTADVYAARATLTAPYWQQGNKAKEGYSYDAYKLYMKDGQEVQRTLIDNTVYKMHPARYYVWPGYAGEVLDPAYQLPYEFDE